jgi:hypothetical protein
MSLTKKIKKVKKGKAPTLINTELANELIGNVNSLSNIKITRGASYDSVHVGTDSIVLSLKEIPDKLEADIDAEEVEFWVCINGSAVKKTFYIKSGS